MPVMIIYERIAFMMISEFNFKEKPRPHAIFVITKN